MTSIRSTAAASAPSLPRAAWDEGLHELEHALQRGVPLPAIVQQALELLVAVSGAVQARWVKVTPAGQLEQLAWPASHEAVALADLSLPLQVSEPVWRIVTPTAAHVQWRIENGTAAQVSLQTLADQYVLWRTESDVPHFALAVAEILADAERRGALRGEQQQAAVWPRLLAAADRWQLAETLDATAQAAVESLRRTLPADRVALLLADQRVPPRWQLQAVSGAALLDRRGDHAAILAELVGHAAILEQPLRFGQVPEHWTLGESESVPQALWQEYADLTAVQGMLILPWQADWRAAASQDLEQPATRSTRSQQQLHLQLAGAEPLLADVHAAESRTLRRGAWVVEWYRHAESESAETSSLPAGQRMWLLQRAAETVEQRRRVETLPAINLIRRWGRYRESWSARGVTLKRLLAVALLALTALLIGLPVPFNITTRARLWPVERREIFAPEDATVVRVLVRHGDRLTADQPLLELTSPALDQQRVQLQGEIATALQRQSSLHAERLRLRGDVEADIHRAQQLTAEEAELSKALASSQAQLAILEQRRAALVLRSPIAGQVLTWNVQEQLAGQPVRRGQLLLSLADPQQAWLAEGRISEEAVGYVRAALEQAGGTLPTQVRTIIEPDTVLPGTLRELSVRSETDPVWGTGVRAVVSLEQRADAATFSPGTEATLRIPCGERAWGFVLFRDVIDGVRRWW